MDVSFYLCTHLCYERSLNGLGIRLFRLAIFTWDRMCSSKNVRYSLDWRKITLTGNQWLFSVTHGCFRFSTFHLSGVITHKTCNLSIRSMLINHCFCDPQKLIGKSMAILDTAGRPAFKTFKHMICPAEVVSHFFVDWFSFPHAPCMVYIPT